MGILRFKTARKAGAYLALLAGVAVCLQTFHVEAQQMVTPGSFEVTSDGAATYTIPIAMPPGTGGMVPSISLDYNSNRPNGLLGVGWTLSGLTVISRCAKQHVFDGIRVANDDTLADPYCMGGSRLMLVSGTHGLAGAEYRTEIEGFAKITAIGTSGLGPLSFEVRTKSGQIMEFGSTADSRLSAPDGSGTVRAWSLSRVSDTVGNYLTISYLDNSVTGTIRPDRIDYTGNTRAGMVPNNSIRFVYEDRPDTETKYQRGLKIAESKRLIRVEAYSEADLVNRYELTYLDATRVTKQSVISQIQLCYGIGVDGCLLPTSFEMSDPPHSSFSTWTASDKVPHADIKDKDLHIGDWNSDGFSDVMAFDKETGENFWYLNDQGIDAALSFPEVHGNPIQPQLLLKSDKSKIFLIDANSDGLTDVMIHDPEDGSNDWFINRGNFLFDAMPNLVQFDQQHLQDWIDEQDEVPSELPAVVGDIIPADFDGDGLVDLLFFYKESGQNLWYRNVTDFGATDDTVDDIVAFALQEANPISKSSIDRFDVSSTQSYTWRPMPGDFNGDGTQDIAWIMEDTTTDRQSPVYVFQNDGAMTFSALSTLTSQYITTQKIHSVVDFNDDGNDDFVSFYSHKADFFWYRHDGAGGFEYEYTPSLRTHHGSPNVPAFGDWNGDGKLDPMYYHGSNCDYNFNNHWFVSHGNYTYTDLKVGLFTPGVLGLFTPRVYCGGFRSTGVLLSGDWNGDGIEDLARFKKSNGQNIWFSKRETRPDLLTKITTGLGQETVVSYAPISDSSVYAKTAPSAYPHAKVSGAIYVVSRVEASDGIGGSYASSYQYEDGETNLQGRGFLGFAKFVATDEQTNLVQYQTFRLDHPFTGFLTKEEQWREIGTHHQLISSSTSEFGSISYGGTRHFPFLSRLETASTDLDGTPMPGLVTTYEYDSFGNATKIIVSAADGSTKTTINTYLNDTVNWFIGRLLSTSVTNDVPSATQ